MNNRQRLVLRGASLGLLVVSVMVVLLATDQSPSKDIPALAVTLLMMLAIPIAIVLFRKKKN